MYYLYLLYSSSADRYYVGTTPDIKRRFYSHNSGKVIATKAYRPWQLVYFEAYPTKQNALNREYKLKRYGQALRQIKARISPFGWPKLGAGLYTASSCKLVIKKSSSGDVIEYTTIERSYTQKIGSHILNWAPNRSKLVMLKVLFFVYLLQRIKYRTITTFLFNIVQNHTFTPWRCHS